MSEGPTNKPRAIYSKCIETGEIVLYSSIAEAGRRGFKVPSVQRCLVGGTKAHRGHRWVYGDSDIDAAALAFAALETAWQAPKPIQAGPVERTPEQIEREEKLRAAELVACEQLSKRVRYDRGNLFWTDSRHAARNGTPAGYSGLRGYQKITARGYGEVLVHRLIFYMRHGYLPKIVDHIDGNRSNNAIENLREATNQQNSSNTKLSAKNTSGHKGVYWDKRNRKWKAYIRVNMRHVALGYFDNIQDAAAARKIGEEKYYGNFARK